MNGRPQSNRSHNAAHHHTPSSPSSTAYRDTHTVISVFFLKQMTVGENPTVGFINTLSNSQDYKPDLTESI
jgi:hypothetical protein